MAIKRPVTVKAAKQWPASAKRRESFCARMGGMKKKRTSKKVANDPGSAINRSLAAWDCDIPVLLQAKHVAKNVRMNPVPPSSRAFQSRKVQNQIDQAKDLYERFTGHDALELGSIDVPELPEVGVAIGEVDGILYSTIRDGKLEKYIHKFRAKDRPLFIVSPNGGALYLVGGNYDFTERGIVDHSDPTR